MLSRASLAEQKAQEELEIANLFLARYPSDPDWMQLGERAHEELGQSLFWKGDLAGALQNLRAALATTQSLATEYPDNKDYEQDLIEKSTGLPATACATRQTLTKRRRNIRTGSTSPIDWLTNNRSKSHG